MTDSQWIPVESWESEQPMCCTICGAEYVGRELGYVPNFCDRDGCEGAPDRGPRVTVVPMEILDA